MGVSSGGDVTGTVTAQAVERVSTSDDHGATATASGRGGI